MAALGAVEALVKLSVGSWVVDVVISTQVKFNTFKAGWALSPKLDARKAKPLDIDVHGLVKISHYFHANSPSLVGQACYLAPVVHSSL